MKIVFFGSGAFGLPTLEHLSREHQITGLVTQPDRRAGRRRQLTPTPVGEWAARRNLEAPIFKPDNLNIPDVREAVRALEADAWVVIAFGQKLGALLLADRFAINLHASLLPRWRGAAPINHAILAGDQETGNSVITLADRMDAGLILGQMRRSIDPLVTAGELHDLLASDGPELVSRVLAERCANTLRPVEQDESLVTIAPKLAKTDGWVDFEQPADVCRRRVHGLTPWPGVTVRIGEEAVKLLRLETSREHSEESTGTLFDPLAGLVACGGTTVVRVLEVQPVGKRPMMWNEFARGRQLRHGDRIVGGQPC